MIPNIDIKQTNLVVATFHRMMLLLKLPVDRKELMEHFAGPQTLKVIRQYQKDNQLPVNEKFVADEPTLQFMMAQLKQLGYLNSDHHRTISGTVKNSNEQGLSNIMLAACDLDLKGVLKYKNVISVSDLMNLGDGFEFLGIATTDQKGFYEIEFYDWMYAKSERRSADVVVFAVNKSKTEPKDLVIGRSAIFQNVEAQTDGVDIIIEEIARQQGEYKVLLNAIDGYLKENGMSLKDIFDASEQISFVAGELDIDLDKIQLIVQANAMEANIEGTLYPELLYGLGRQKIPLDWESLHRTSVDVLRKALDQAFVDKDIDKFSDVKINAFLDYLKTVTAAKMLEPQGDEPNIANDLLTLSLSKLNERIVYIKAINNYTGTDENEFWESYLPKQTGFKANTIKNLRKNQKLFALSGAHLPLVKTVANSIKELPELVQWDLGNWEDLVVKTGFPSHVTGDTKKEKIKNYATDLRDNVNGEYVTAAVQHKIDTKIIPIKNNTAHKKISKFLSSTKDFDIKKSQINDFKKKIGGKAAVLELKELQRLVRLNPDTSLIPVLKSKNMTSAMKITEYDSKTFGKEFGEFLGGTSKALIIHGNALQINAKITLTETGIRNHFNGFPSGYTIDPDIYNTTRSLIEERFPGYSTIYNVNLCECNHCNSVYSPAAYFVDLMRYLQKGTTKAGKTPSDVFKKRRPDLFHLPLTCENSNTLIPYIDLANEVMENYIFYTHGDGNDVDFEQFKSADIDGATEEELRAQAQYIKKETYRILAEEAVYPSSLPLSLPLEILNTYSKQLSSTLYDILETTFKFNPSEVNENILNAAGLGLSEIEFAAITSKNFNGAATLKKSYWEYYGFPSASLLKKKLAQVPEFLKRTGLQYTEMITLFQIGFVNPNLQLLAFLESIVKEVAGLDGSQVYASLKAVAHSNTPLPAEITHALNEKGIPIDFFMKWVRVNFDQLSKAITLYEKTSACDISVTEIKSVANLYETPKFNWTESLALNINAFLRIWRKTNWSMIHLDTVLKALDISPFNPENLGKFTAAKRFIDKTGTDPKHAAVLWGNMGYWHTNNLYSELFLSRSMEVNPIFVPQPGRAPFEDVRDAGSQLRISNLIVEIQAALNVEEADLMAIFRHAEIDVQTAKVSISKISIAYRYILFANICGISITELIQSIQLFELQPFADPLDSLEGLNQITNVRNSNFTIEELAYIFDEETIDYSKLLLEDTVITDLGQVLPLEYEKINSQEIKGDSPGDVEAIRVELKQTFTYNLLGDFLNISSEIIMALAKTEIDSLITSFNDDDWLALVKNLNKSALAILKFELTDDEAKYFIDNPSEFDNPNLKNLTHTHWLQLYDYITFKENLQSNSLSPISIFEFAAQASVPDIEGFAEKIREVTGWAKADILYVLSRYSDVTEFRIEQVLLSLQKVNSVTKRIGINPESLFNLVPENWGFDELWKKSQTIKRIVKSKYSRSTWNTVATKLNDALREKQRDALVAYLLSMPVIKKREIIDADGLYEFFLIDVEMNACMDTSRIVQASAAIQQFVNRIHLNLEKEVDQDALNGNRWQWMKYYRLWEAQMRIWYENPIYLKPEWRMDKSEFFEDLESLLTKNDITDRSAEEALRGYLKSLDEVANLNVAGMYEEKDNLGNKKTLHVFGHTNHTPYKYFYRTYNFKYDKWSAWTKVDAAIQPVVNTEAGGKSGVHLIPVVWKNRVLLFWPEFMEKAEPQIYFGRKFETLSKETPIPPKKYWEVRLAWSEYYENTWTAKQVSEEFIILNEFTAIRLSNKKIMPNRISFQSNISNEDVLSVSVVPFSPSPSSFEDDYLISPQSSFIISSISDRIQVQVLNLKAKKIGLGSDVFFLLLGLSQSWYRNYYFTSKYEYSFSQTNIVNSTFVVQNIYLRNSSKHHLIFPNTLQYFENPIDYSFFYSSGNKTYFITPWVPNMETSTFSDGSSIIFFYSFNKLDFHSFHHPFVADFISNLNKNGISSGNETKPGLMDSDTLEQTDSGVLYDDKGFYFEDTFDPTSFVYKPADLAASLTTYYKETIDFASNGANSKYNWELFFHAPLYIATQLSKNGKFEEALKWFHYIFDPTTDEIPNWGLVEVSRFWKVKPFKYDNGDSFQDFINDLTANSEAEDPIIAEWRDNPFSPHLVAAHFPVNYKKYTILAYVENLVEWADSKFRKFTRENVYEAIQIYVLASHILGPKPPFVPSRGIIKKETFASLDLKLNDLSNARVEMENSIGYSSGIHDLDDTDSPSISGTGLAFYFCVPPNEKLLKYWEIVEDRLYKIRNCKDINGVARRLALFAPPIDPALLIKATSAGLDLDTFFSELNMPNPHYRFAYLLQKANEFCNDVKSLGNALLSAIEKQDGEALSRLRSTHEVDLLNMVQGIKERQVLDAKISVEQLEKQRETAIDRFAYYNESLLGNEPVAIPQVIPLSSQLAEDSHISTNPNIQKIVPDVDVSLVEGSERGLKIIPKEREDIELRRAATVLGHISGSTKLAASIAALFPMLDTKMQPLGVGVAAGYGGQNVALGLQLISEASQTVASTLNQAAALASTGASYIRREQEWTHQANLTIKEIEQLEIQILSAGIRLQVAEKDLENHKKQITNAKAIETYLKDKFTNKEFYGWMKDELTGLHKKSFDMAFEMAKKAEIAYEFEKGPFEDQNIIDYSYWDNSRYGLLAGEKLQLGLRKLDIAYQEKNTRQFELTKHISLKRLNPIELIRLRETGVCNLALPEELFDLDYPGHFKRRVKSVSLSIPCVVGPYTTIPCTLRLTSNKIRIDAASGASYPETEDMDLRFITQQIPMESIATSSAQNDSGVFELNFRDERYVPFEGAGVISSWELELFHEKDGDFGKSLRQFDYSTIGDVILHLKFTSEENEALKTPALANLKTYFENTDEDAPYYKIVDIKRDFASEWNRYMHPDSDTEENSINLKLTPNHFPFRDQTQNLSISKITIVADSVERPESTSLSIALEEASRSNTILDSTTDKLPGFGNLQVLRSGVLTAVQFEFKSVQEVTWNLRIEKSSGESLNENDVKDMYMILKYSRG